MDLKRFLQHAIAMPWQTRRAFSKTVCDAIEQAITASEQQHLGEIRFVVEGQMDGQHLWRGCTARQRAIELFSQLHIWDTEHNSGVLVYVLFAERQIEIVADRGISSRVHQDEWDGICQGMSMEFRRGDYGAGSVAGLQRITELLVQHFPGTHKNRNELTDKVTLL
jgi:uncharacterized membrane protein